MEVYADADEVELLVNGRSLGRQPSGAPHRYRSAFETVYEPGLLEAVAWRGGTEESGRIGAPLRHRAGACSTPRVDRAVIAADPEDLAFVTLSLVDADGVLHSCRATGGSTCEVDGPGVLQALGSANPATEEGFTGTSVHHVRRPRPRRRPAHRARADHARAPRRTGCEPQQVEIDARA